jgi:hypothetical protein
MYKREAIGISCNSETVKQKKKTKNQQNIAKKIKSIAKIFKKGLTTQRSCDIIHDANR